MTDSRGIQSVYDAERFRAEGHRLVDRLADYLGRATRGEEMPVVAVREPEEAAARWPGRFGAGPSGETLDGLIGRVLDEASHQHHPRYVGHQVAPVVPLAALCELAAALLNNGMAAFEAGPVSTAMERAVLKWMAGKLGWEAARAEGVLTSGGSLGNLTALLAARQAVAADAPGEKLAILAAGQAHYSVARAALVMGFGAGGVVPVAVDARYRMRADALGGAVAAAERAGRRAIAVVASAGSTATGAIDPMDSIADFCEERGLWLHVDGAHGATAALSERHRGALAGIERADSVVWDAHKMLAMPSLITAVLYRDGERSYGAFSQSASYLFHGQPRWWDVGLRTLECTKRMMSLKLYAALSLYGERPFADYVERQYALARRFAALLRAAGDFEVAVEPEANIVCFRYLAEGATDLDGLQERARKRIVASGEFYLVQVALDGKVWLRTTLMNPFTEERHLLDLMAAIRRAA
jgi:L-2,4-diaminobutyrate decarboxylase